MINCPGSLDICFRPDPEIVFFCFGPFCQKKNSNKLTCQDTQNELYQLHLGNEGLYEEQRGEQLSYPVLPLLAVCLHGGYHQKCSCFQLLLTFCKGGWADHKLVSSNKLLPAVPHRRMDKKRQRNSFGQFGCWGFFSWFFFFPSFVFLILLRSFQVQEG